MPDSAAERAARHRAKHGTRINKNRVLNRVKGGSLPTWNSMEKYDIGLPAINTIKNETKQPLIYEPNQLSEERGKPMKKRPVLAPISTLFLPSEHHAESASVSKTDEAGFYGMGLTESFFRVFGV